MQTETGERCSRSQRLLRERHFLTSRWTLFCCEADPPERSRYYSPIATRTSTNVKWRCEKKPLCRFVFCVFDIKFCNTFLSSHFHFCMNPHIMPQFSKMRNHWGMRPKQALPVRQKDFIDTSRYFGKLQELFEHASPAPWGIRKLINLF